MSFALPQSSDRSQDRRSGRALPARRLVAALATLAAMAAVTLGLLVLPEYAARPPGPAEAPPPEWVEIARPFRLYALPSGIFGREPAAYEARRHSGGQGRIDTLTYGAPAGDGAVLRLDIHRFGAAPAEDAAFFVDMARLAARAGRSVLRAGVSALMPTRFGAFEVADLQLAQGPGAGEAACLGFRLAAADPGLSIAGFACGTPARPLDRQTLACVLDRLDLVAAGEDKALGRWFADTELRRGEGCADPRAARAGFDRPALKGTLAPRREAKIHAGRGH